MPRRADQACHRDRAVLGRLHSRRRPAGGRRELDEAAPDADGRHPDRPARRLRGHGRADHGGCRVAARSRCDPAAARGPVVRARGALVDAARPAPHHRRDVAARRPRGHHPREPRRQPHHGLSGAERAAAPGRRPVTRRVPVRVPTPSVPAPGFVSGVVTVALEYFHLTLTSDMWGLATAGWRVARRRAGDTGGGPVVLNLAVTSLP
ncbi:hypothetical protein FRAHR75_30040 [Frankia sp. Hr75.2]|nr:hypothetical protein FRAHR75_30040 [Frankia sp. Hr75.2]